MWVLMLGIVYFFAPLGILWLCFKYRVVNKIGSVLIAYVLGILIASTGLFKGDEIDQIQEVFMSVSIPFSIPLLLFSNDFKKSLLLARNTFFSLMAALLGLLIVIIGGYFLFGGHSEESMHKVAGLLCGVYTGGTPNLAALKMALNIDAQTYISIHTYDMLFSTIHLFIIISVGKRILNVILPAFKPGQVMLKDKEADKRDELFGGIFNRENRIPLLIALVITIVIVAVGGLLMMMVAEKSKMAVFILAITSLAIMFSLNSKVRNIPKTYDLGMYFILIFSVVVASKLSLGELRNIDFTLFYYVVFAVFGSTILHVLFSKFFKVDADTVLVTSVSLICSPPFVPVVAGSIKNKEIVVHGITVGVIGYAIGTYLGYVVSLLLQYL